MKIFDECIINNTLFDMIKSESKENENIGIQFGIKLTISRWMPDSLIGFVKDKQIVKVIDLRKKNNDEN